MKIYTEITMQWDDDKGKLVEVSSESYNYKGRVDECKGGFLSRFGRGLGSMFGGHQMFAPSYLENESRFSGGLPGTLSKHPFTHYAGKSAGPGVKTGQDVLSGRQKMGSSKFKDDYYDPMFEAYNRAPVAAMMGSKNYEGAGTVRPGASEFMTAREALSPTGFSGIADKLLQQTQGIDLSGHGKIGYANEPLVLRGQRGELSSAASGLQESQREYDTEQGRLDDVMIEAEKAKKAGFKESTIQRLEASRGKIPEYEKAKALEAKTGMAYSAPARGQVDLTQQASEKTLGDISRERYGVAKDFRTAKEGVATDRGISEDVFSAEKGDFKDTFRGVMDATGQTLGDMYSKADTLTDRWSQGFGKASGAGGWGGLSQRKGRDPHGEEYGGGGYGGGGYFREGLEDIPEIDQLGALGSEVQAIADALGGAGLDTIFDEGGV